MKSPATAVWLLFAVLLTAPASHGFGCELICNGACDVTYKACSQVPASKPTCLSTQTTCKSSCAKVCSCNFQCEIDCTKPQGACKSKAPAAKDFVCTAQQFLCKKVYCPIKCAFTNVPIAIPSLPKLGDIKTAASSLPSSPADLFKAPNGLPANPFQNAIPGFPANPINNPLSLNSKPADSVAKAAKPSFDFGNAFANPAAKTPNLAAGLSPDSDNSEEEQPITKTFQAVPSPPKEIPKPVNPFTNPASSKVDIPTVPTPIIPPKKKGFMFGNRQ